MARQPLAVKTSRKMRLYQWAYATRRHVYAVTKLQTKHDFVSRESFGSMGFFWKESVANSKLDSMNIPHLPVHTHTDDQPCAILVG